MPVNPISAAVSLYLGHGLGPSPQEDASRLTSRFGYDAPHLENQVRSLLAELDKIRPDWNAHTFLSGSQWAVAQLAYDCPFSWRRIWFLMDSGRDSASRPSGR